MIDQIFADKAKCTGRNHELSDKVCEDYSVSFSDDNVRIIIVADGHGNNNYPRAQFGSKFASESALEMMTEFVKSADADSVIDNNANHIIFWQLEASILNRWHEKVNEHFNNNPLTDAELSLVSEKIKAQYQNGERIAKAYGTTLIAFAITKDYSFGIQIGDGLCVCFNDDLDASIPIPDDDKCFLNVTTSICDDDAIDEFRFIVLDKTPAAVFLGTDGIDDSYSSNEQLFEMYRSMISLFVKYDTDFAKKEIEDYLPVITKKGSGDDVSIAYAVDMSRIKDLTSRFEENEEKTPIPDSIDHSTNETANADNNNEIISADIDSNDYIDSDAAVLEFDVYSV